MLSDRVSNPGPPTYESGALPIALRGPAVGFLVTILNHSKNCDVGGGMPSINTHLNQGPIV